MMNKVDTFLVFGLIVTGICSILGYPCRLPNGNRGECSPLSRCPQAAILFIQGIAPEFCRGTGSELFVCCDLGSPQTVVPQVQTRTTEERCQFPNGEIGVCTPSFSCSREDTWFPYIYCGSQGAQTICCRSSRPIQIISEPIAPSTTTISPTTLATTTTTTKTTTTPATVANKQLQVNQNEPCKLKSGEDGVCLFTFQCPSAVEGISSGIIPTICGTLGRETLVCCQHSKFAPNPILPETPKALNTLSISEEKCIDYHTHPEKYSESKIKQSHIFVVGGVPSVEKEFPHMAALGFGSTTNVQWLCGGTLISPNFILTAAHCTFSQEVGAVKFARMGLLNLNVITNNLQDFVVTKIYRHPDYKPPETYNDIALLRLNKDADFSEYVKPACLYTSHQLPSLKPYATGWGRTQFQGESSDVLQKVDLHYYPIEKCREVFASVSKLKLPNGILDEFQVCAGGVNEKKDTCNGDSGGPLQSKVEPGAKTPYYIIGITSFGKACGLINMPAVYTRISHYVPWIESIVWGTK